MNYANYVSKYATKLKSDPKTFWRFVNEKRKINGIPTSMSLNDKHGESPKDVANLFAEHFESVYVEDSGTEFQFQVDQKLDFNSIDLSVEEVHKGLLDLNRNKPAGPDSIHPIFFIDNADILCHPVHKLFLQSLEHGEFATCWKTAYLTPIFKSGLRANIANYRGICKLNVLPKLFEKLVCEKITLKVVPHLHQAQHGFLAG